jgi:hypothetical protein
MNENSLGIRRRNGCRPTGDERITPIQLNLTEP